MLGVGQHEVVCICKRMGGAFGGKESQAAIPAMMAALVAHKTGRSARVIYNKDDDMRVTGKRHAYLQRMGSRLRRRRPNSGAARGVLLERRRLDRPFAGRDGTHAAAHRQLLLSAARGADRPGVLHQPAVEHGVPRLRRAAGHGGHREHSGVDRRAHRASTRSTCGLAICTASASATSRRTASCSTAIICQKSSPRLPPGRSTASGATRLLDFNATSRTQVRGLAMTGVKFGISFTTSFLNQGNALVNIYTDGTVQVSTGATEMGQGVNVKIRQLVADEFAIDVNRVVVMPTSTEKNINTSPTAASAGTDLNGAAAVEACRIIKRRLRRFAASRLADAKMGLGASASHVQFRDGHVHR